METYTLQSLLTCSYTLICDIDVFLVKIKVRSDVQMQLLQKRNCESVCRVSFGAFTTLAVADALKRLHNLEAVHIFLSGASAPYVSGFKSFLQYGRQTGTDSKTKIRLQFIVQLVHKFQREKVKPYNPAP